MNVSAKSPLKPPVPPPQPTVGTPGHAAFPWAQLGVRWERRGPVGMLSPVPVSPKLEEGGRGSGRASLPTLASVGIERPSRCSERGCIYPAGASGKCLHHERLLLEPTKHESRQPISAVLEQAHFGVPDAEGSDTRGRDRRRWRSERERFLNG